MRRKVLLLAVLIMSGITAWAAVTLTIGFGTPNVQCTPEGGTASVDYTVSSTEASATAVVETLTDSNRVVKKTNSYSIVGSSVPGGWTVAGRTKAFDAMFQATGLADGDYSLEVCVTQARSGGNADKKVCQTTAITVKAVKLL